VRKAARYLPLAGVALMVLGWWYFLAPTFLGGPLSYVMVRGVSMEPTLSEGDLVITRRQGSYDVGDVVAFHVPEGKPGAGALIIHRIAGLEGESYVMQGDNKDAPDPWRPTGDEVAGKRWLTVPGGAPYLARLREPAFIGAFAAALTVFFVLAGAPTAKRAVRRDAPLADPEVPKRWSAPKIPDATTNPVPTWHRAPLVGGPR
jgi:signal peptidase